MKPKFLLLTRVRLLYPEGPVPREAGEAGRAKTAFTR